MYVVAITGGIATGKSTVTRFLLELGYPVIDLDYVARQVVEVGQPCWQAIVDRFGTDILQQDQTLNRKKLGELVFNDSDALEQLNQIMHPAIYQATLQQLAYYREKAEPLCFIDIPLLFETEENYPYDESWLIYVPENIQLERLMARDHLSKEEALQRMKQQQSIEWKKTVADRIIYNDGSFSQTYQQVRNELERIGKLITL